LLQKNENSFGPFVIFVIKNLVEDKVKVLILQPWIRLGGAELISVHLAAQLQQRGHTAKIVCTFLDLTGMPEQAHTVQYVLPPRWLARWCEQSRLFFLLFGPWIMLVLAWQQAHEVDLLNPHNFPSAWVASVVGTLQRLPIVWTCNEPPTRAPAQVGFGDFVGWLIASSWLDKWLVKRFDAIYVPSQKTREQVKARYGWEAEVVPLGVEASFFEHPPGHNFIASLNLENKFVLMCVGKLHPQKNQRVCLEALQRVLPDIPNAVLLLAGAGPLTKFYQALAAELGITDHVQFLGTVTSQQARDLYHACAINLFPSIDQSWGLTPFEALCAERVSIVSSDSGAAEVFTQEKLGVVCAPTAEAFAEAIRRIYRDPLPYQRMAAKGRDYTTRQLTWSRYAEAVLSLFERALDQPLIAPKGIRV
jgi:glycosyltransferase involved in cell wall biosynthesis